jgi:hypothetical protein
MALVLIPIWGPDTSLWLVAGIAPLSLIVYAVSCLLSGALPWSDVKQVWQLIARRATARSAAVAERPPTRSGEINAECNVEPC